MQITVQVFATWDEIRDWIAYQDRRFGLNFALVKHWTEFEVVPLAGWDEFDQRKDAEHWRQIWIDLRPLRHRCRGPLDCCAQNRDRLILDLPETRPEGLRRGSLGTLSEDGDHLRVWRAIIRYFRSRTTAGMWVMNPSSRARGFYKFLRYSPGVAELHRRGLFLLDLAEGMRVFVEEPEI